MHFASEKSFAVFSVSLELIFYFTMVKMMLNSIYKNFSPAWIQQVSI